MEELFSIDQLDLERLLKEWRWLCPQPVTLLARNGFGDLFLRTAEGKVLWLDVGGGTLSEVADSESVFRDLLKHAPQRELWLAEAVLEAGARHGLKPNNVQCIGFKIPIVFAESAAVPDNAYVADLYEQVSFLGDLHRQIADTPDGGKVRLRIGAPPARR